MTKMQLSRTGCIKYYEKDRKYEKMIIGIDDTDSNEGMCTTYLGAVLLEELQIYGIVETLPLLVRLNPTIPYKTRGNASIALKLKTNFPEKVIAYILSRIEELAHMDCTDRKSVV